MLQPTRDNFPLLMHMFYFTLFTCDQLNVKKQTFPIQTSVPKFVHLRGQDLTEVLKIDLRLLLQSVFLANGFNQSVNGLLV